MNLLAPILWRASQHTVTIPLEQSAAAVSTSLAAALVNSAEFHGKVVNQGFKIWRSRDYAQSRNTFAPILYGVVTPTPQGSQIEAHFQFNPVTRLFLITWFAGTSILALLSLIGGLWRATPESSAIDALPYLLPALLPFAGWWILRWQQRRGQTDEEQIKAWLADVLQPQPALSRPEAQRSTIDDRS